MIDVFRVGVLLTMRSNAHGVINVITKEVGGLHREVTATEAAMMKVRVAVAGLGAMAFGGAILEGIKSMVEHAVKLNDELTKLKVAGFTDRDVASSKEAAFNTTQLVPTSQYADNVKAVRELASVLNSIPEAQKFLPDFQKAKALITQYTGAEGEESTMVLTRMIELSGGASKDGKIDMVKMRESLEAGLHAIVAAGGFVTPQMLLQFAQTAGPMARMYNSGKAMWNDFLTSVIDMKGFRAGTAVAATGRMILGGIMAQRQGEALMDMGMIDPSKYHVRRGGQVKVDEGAITGTDIYKDEGVFAWVQKVYEPHLKAYLAKQGKELDNANLAEALYRDFPTETMRRMVASMIQNEGQVTRDIGLQAQQPGMDQQYQTMMDTNWKANMDAFNSAWSNLITVLADPAVSPAIGILQSITDGINYFTGVIKNTDPETLKHFAEGLAALAAICVVGGALVVAGAAIAAFVGVFSLPVWATLIGIAGGLAAIAYMLGLFPHHEPKPGDKDYVPKPGDAYYDPGLDKWNLNNYLPGHPLMRRPQAPGEGTWDSQGHQISGPGTPAVARKSFWNWLFTGDDAAPGSLPAQMNHPVGEDQQDIWQRNRGPTASTGDVKVYIDGKEVAARIMRNIAHDMSGPQDGTGDFDPTRTYTPVEQ